VGVLRRAISSHFFCCLHPSPQSGELSVAERRFGERPALHLFREVPDAIGDPGVNDGRTPGAFSGSAGADRRGVSGAERVPVTNYTFVA
jgi:hypothetical protein